jgi:hypothetical protein
VELFLTVLFIAAGISLPVAAYYNKMGQIGFGSESALERQRRLSRGRAFIAGPLIFVIGIVMLVNHLSE